MAIRRLPNLTPDQVVAAQDALLSNADSLLTAALGLLEAGNIALARSLAILGLEESGKAIAIHTRRVQIVRDPEGEPFVNAWLEELWASHQRKLEIVYDFLVGEQYWFGVQPSDPDENAAYLGTIKAWTRRNDKVKQRGFYVELTKAGDPLSPSDVADEEALADVIAHVHQIGWQIRLGEHIEGKQQDSGEQGIPPSDPEESSLIDALEDVEGVDAEFLAGLRDSIRSGVPGRPLRNAAYRFNPPGADRSPFRNVGRPGYEAETRELMRLSDELDRMESE